MFALSTPKSGRLRTLFRRGFRGAGRMVGWAALVAAVLTLLTVVTIEPSQACPERNNPAPHATQHVAKFIAKQSAVASPAVTSAFKGSGGCCDDRSGHCHGVGAGSCCPACTAGVVAAGWTIARTFILQLDFPLLQTRAPSIDFDSQFRPPRIIL